MAMFVFVIDTSLMNVSISAVVRDLDTTVSGVQSAVALEALVSAAFILIGSKLGDLFGRKRAYVVGLLFYASGALAMVVAQGLAAIIVFWAIIGGLGAALYLPAMQSLIHGNFEGTARAKVFAMIGASAAIAAAVGPLIGGFLTTLLSWRVGFLLEAAIIGGVLAGSGLIREVPYTGDRSVDVVGSVLSVLGMSLLVLGVLAWQEGGESVAALLVAGVVFSLALVWWLRRRGRERKATLFDLELFKSKLFSLGITQSILQQIALGGLLIALPIYLQLDLGYNALQAGISLAPLSLTMFFIALLAGRRAGRRRPSSLHPRRLPAARGGGAGHDPDRPARRHELVPRHSADALRSRTGAAGLAAQQLHACPHLRGAGRRGRGGQLGDLVVRPIGGTGVRGRDPARRSLDRLHQQV
jgi:MFS family permease